MIAIMNRRCSLLKAAGLALIAVLATTQYAMACSCAFGFSLPGWVRYFQDLEAGGGAVVTGTVVRSETGVEATIEAGTETTVAVDRWWFAGDLEPSTEIDFIMYNWFGTSCEMQLAVGTEANFFLHRQENGALATAPCTIAIANNFVDRVHAALNWYVQEERVHD